MDKTVLITGGSSGLGYAAAERFLAEGATVFIAARRPDEVHAAASTLGPGAHACPVDVTRAQDRDRMYAEISRTCGSLDAMVANGGGPFFGTIEDYTDETLDRSWELNGKAVVRTVQKALPLMPDRGAIVLMSSIKGERGTPGLGAYAAMKAAQQSFARTWANELAPRRIRVNAIQPGRHLYARVRSRRGQRGRPRSGRAAYPGRAAWTGERVCGGYRVPRLVQRVVRQRNQPRR